jgi:acetyl esterase/lipase
MFRFVPGSFPPTLRAPPRPYELQGPDTNRAPKDWNENLESKGKFMLCRRICFLLLTVVATSLSAYAQQDQASNTKTAKTQPGNISQTGNINLPVSTENWGLPGDIKTGLEPLPPVLFQSAEQPEFVRELYRLQWREADPIDVWLIRPKVAGKVPEKAPVILYLYNYADNDERFRDNQWCKRATADGYAAVGFVSALTDYRFRNRGLSKWFVSELAESLGSTTHDVQLILDFLAQRADIDMSRVGMFGLGSGATIAILAAQADARITTLDLLDPWGDWPDWVSKSALVPPKERPKYESKEFLHSIAMLDPVSYLPTLKTPNVRLQLMLNGQITPPAARERIAAAVPFRATVVKYQSTEDLFKAWQTAGLSGWIKEQLRAQLPRGTGDDHRISKN